MSREPVLFLSNLIEAQTMAQPARLTVHEMHEMQGEQMRGGLGVVVDSLWDFEGALSSFKVVLKKLAD